MKRFLQTIMIGFSTLLLINCKKESNEIVKESYFIYKGKKILLKNGGVRGNDSIFYFVFVDTTRTSILIHPNESEISITLKNNNSDSLIDGIYTNDQTNKLRIISCDFIFWESNNINYVPIDQTLKTGNVTYQKQQGSDYYISFNITLQDNSLLTGQYYGSYDIMKEKKGITTSKAP